MVKEKEQQQEFESNYGVATPADGLREEQGDSQVATTVESGFSSFGGLHEFAGPEELSQTKQALLEARQELFQVQQELNEARLQLDLLTRAENPTITQYQKDQLRREIALESLGKYVLEQNAKPNSNLETTVAAYLTGIERLHPGMLCACMGIEGGKLYTIAAPSLPESYTKAIEGTAIGENVGSCGTAAFLGQKIIATDISQDPRWVVFKDLALAHGLKASWSFPIMRATGEVLGTLAIYYAQIKAPSAEEQTSLESIRNLLQLIIENKLAEKALKESNERLHYTSMATSDAIYDWAVNSEFLHWGMGFEKIFGTIRTPQTSTMAYWESRLYHADREKLMESLRAALQDSTQNYWQVEYRYVKADGFSLGHISERGFIIRNENGTAIRMVGALQEITERKVAEEELRKLSVIAKETINGVLVMAPDLTLQWTNQAFAKITGYSLEEVKGKRPGTFLNGRKTDPRTIAYIDQQLKLLQPLECELIQYNKAGEKRWIKLQIQPLKNAAGEVESVFAFLTDITQQKKEVQQLRLLESVITNSYEAISICRVYSSEPKLKTIFFNKAFLELSGYTEEDISGKSPVMLNGPETDEKAMEGFFSALEDGRVHHTELLGYRKSGEAFWAFASALPIYNDENTLTHWIFIMRDITNHKHYEQERELLISELNQNNADLKQFSFITSHNLRAPLANLKGIINLLDMESLPEGKNKVLIQKFSESTLQLNNIIDDLLEILVIKNGVQIKKEPLSLTAAFEKVKASVDRLLSEIEATVETDFTDGDIVEFNSGYLHSILLNLLTNAIKYRHPDRPLVITIKSLRRNGRTEVLFSDNGLGLDLERYRDRIFGLYQRFHKHQDSKGMGLYIAQSQAKAMGGQLEVESEVNMGTTFTLQIA